jgi:divalent metal cation (Fe/Co/Zn/Cd) transporter
LKLSQPPTVDARDSVGLLRRGMRFEYLTLCWNMIGTAISLAAAVAAHSPALVGFGLASLIGTFASVIVVRKLTGENRERERRTQRLIGYAFLALVMYLLTQSMWVLTGTTRPEAPGLGLIWLAASFVVMLLLARGKRATGRRLGEPVLIAEATATLFNALLAGTVLAGLAANASLGWWWADPVAALMIVVYGLHHGLAALERN